MNSSNDNPVAARPTVSPKITDRAWLIQQAKLLNLVSPWRIFADLARTWALIFIALAIFFIAPSIATFVFAFIAIATQQYALLILMHEGQHWMLHSNRGVNNFISNWLIGAPCGAPFQSSQQQHLAHHRNLGSPTEDPAFVFYCFGNPSPKETPRYLAEHFFKILLAGRFSYTLLGGIHAAAKQEGTGDLIGFRLRAYAPILAMQGLVLLAFTIAGYWWAYVFLWALPLVTLVSFFDAFRQFAEHAHPIPDGMAKTLLVSTKSNFFERIFFAPFGMNFHAEHHLFPFVPYYRLAKLSLLIKDSPEKSDIEWRRSYVRCLIDYVRSIKAQRNDKLRSTQNE